MNTQYVDNLLGWAWVARRHGIELFGKRWYDEAHNVASWLAYQYNRDIESAVGLIAVLSPGCGWIKNLIDAESLLNDRTSKVSTYGRNKQKALDILDYGDPDAVVSGQKVTAFYHNILDRESPDVTVDRHAARTVLQSPGDEPLVENVYQRAISTPKRHAEVVEIFTQAARVWSVKPSEMQAIAWVAFRRLNGQDKNDMQILANNYSIPIVKQWADRVRRYNW